MGNKMKAIDRAIARKHLDKRLNQIRQTESLTRPPTGWIRAIRQALGMTTTQLAKRIGVGQSRVVDIEKAEITGSLTLESLERAANALDCKLVYALVPRKPLQETIEERAKRLAQERLSAVSHYMALEDQSLEAEDEQAQLKELVKQIVEKAGSEIWKENI